MTLDEVWLGLERALEGHPFVSVGDLREELERGWSEYEGGAQLFVGPSSALFARADLKAGVVELGPAAGDLDEIVTLVRPHAEEWAARHNCFDIHVQAGRGGWERVLKPHGYELAAVILRKALPHGTE